VDDMGRAIWTPGSGTLETPHGRGELPWGAAKTAAPRRPERTPQRPRPKCFFRRLSFFVPVIFLGGEFGVAINETARRCILTSLFSSFNICIYGWTVQTKPPRLSSISNQVMIDEASYHGSAFLGF
jgi:hypothetical protein